MNNSLKCWPQESLILSGSQLETVLYGIFFPPICILGITGNVLNLMVLLTPQMNSRANALLSCLAFTDIVFLVLMIPHSLANFNAFALNYHFRLCYLNARLHLITFANWTSAVAIWLVLGICIERVLGIKYPFRTHNSWSRSLMAIIILLILVIAGALTFYNHFSHICIVRKFCDRTQVLSKCFDVTIDMFVFWPGNYTNSASIMHRNYVKWSIIANAVFVVIIPIFLLAGLNISLIVLVKRRSYVLNSSSKDIESCHQRKNYSLIPNNAMKRRNDQLILHQKTEHRLGITVCSIVTCFTLTQGPSAVAISITSFSSQAIGRGHPEFGMALYHMLTITSFLVIVGKALNFLLFCSSSAHFRRQLLALLRSKLNESHKRKKYETTGDIL